MAFAPQDVRFDIDLTERDVQELGSSDVVAAFFARLGYNTNARTVQTPGNLGISADSTLRPIRRIELVADQGGLFQVYLFELASVTVAHTRALARAFRNRAGNFLLVLTSDYSELDFVLLERFLPRASEEGSISERQVGIRPRTLTVERRKSRRRELRVLRRFTWTEGDGFAQYEKLLAAFSYADWSEEHFNNRALFSDYYLLERLRDFPEWREDPKPTYLALRELFLNARGRLAGKANAELLASLAQPIAHALGFDCRPGKPHPGHDEPDFRLYSPSGDKPLALLLAYSWDRSLDGKDDKRDTEYKEENPGAIVVSLLAKEEAPWVILTNGRLWRLYAKQTHSRATNYYELDAEELLADTGKPVANPGDAFRYFWLLFRRQAFEKRATQREGKSVELSLLDQLLLESEDYAKELGSRLKDRVFEEVFPQLTEGFVEHLRAESGTRAVQQEVLDAIYQGTLTLLYRLLFLLYAEARDLLPVREVRGYWEASLTHLKQDIARQAGDIEDEIEAKLKKAYRPDNYALWERIGRLFKVVDRGDAALNVPFYNGGLFLTDPDKDDDTPEAVTARFLAKHRVGDRYLAQAIDLLSRTVDDKRHSLVFIDYKSLGVRQLGSIYEGLLEFKVRIAGEKLAIQKEKGREVYAPFDELDERAAERAERTGRLVKKGAVYLENDKRERKASGSYYTPDYIVEYIVAHTVGPVLVEKFEKIRPKLRAAQAERRAFFEKQKALEARRLPIDLPAKADRIGEELVNELFDIKVLDPAMGSAHFLVEAVDLITDGMLAFLNAFPWNPVQAYLARVREEIREEAERQDVTLDPAKLTDVNLLKRHVLKRCIYGVDLNPMAVELAKVSLWLDCFTLGAPLSFLDHHLRCGNSLIGITERQFEESQKQAQLSLLEGSQYAGAKLAVGAMIEVGMLPDITPAQTQESRRHYSIAVEALAPVKRLFDVYTSQWFGNEPRTVGKGKNRSETNPAKDLLADPICQTWAQNPDKTKLPELFKKVADTALDASAKYRFFHWDLEFPEVFFGPRPGTTQVIERLDGAGFDAVISNPPYVSAWAMTDADEDIRSSIAAVLENTVVLSSHWDLYVAFLLRAYAISRMGGYFSYILPNPFTREKYAQPIREFLLQQSTLRSVVEFGVDNVFDEVARQTILVVIQKTAFDSAHEIVVHSPVSLVNRSAEPLMHIPQRLLLSLPGCHVRTDMSPEVLRVLNVIERWNTRVGNLLYINYGAQVSSREKGAFGKKALISNTPKKGLKPFFEGKDLSRFDISNRQLYLNYRPEIMYGPRSPDLFESEKVVLRHISGEGDTLVVSLDVNQLYCDHGLILGTFYFNLRDTDLRGEFEGYEQIPVEGYNLAYLAGLLASRTLSFVYKGRYATGSLQGEFSHVYPQHVRALPIRPILFRTSGKDRKELADRALRSVLTERSKGKFEDLARVLDICLSSNAEKVDVVHDIIVGLTRKLLDLRTMLNKTLAKACRVEPGVTIDPHSLIVDLLSSCGVLSVRIDCREIITRPEEFRENVRNRIQELLAKKLGKESMRKNQLRDVITELAKDIEDLALVDDALEFSVVRLFGLDEDDRVVITKYLLAH